MISPHATPPPPPPPPATLKKYWSPTITGRTPSLWTTMSGQR